MRSHVIDRVAPNLGAYMSASPFWPSRLRNCLVAFAQNLQQHNLSSAYVSRRLPRLPEEAHFQLNLKTAVKLCRGTAVPTICRTPNTRSTSILAPPALGIADADAGESSSSSLKWISKGGQSRKNWQKEKEAKSGLSGASNAAEELGNGQNMLQRQASTDLSSPRLAEEYGRREMYMA